MNLSQTWAHHHTNVRDSSLTSKHQHKHIVWNQERKKAMCLWYEICRDLQKDFHGRFISI